MEDKLWECLGDGTLSKGEDILILLTNTLETNLTTITLETSLLMT